ncbi:hypothetical protein [Mycolicibacterium aubagnense]|uniref:Lipoprotein n=1 Tax=Mycolicibacterium aubagnense TaxID=319707 RepID=A0ABM7IEQ6_9MYCO|nr:hypothetical protein [Mycolicibacterium aubagnense]TLH49408.1 hypothetical protein C1S80_27145 [Mycolicibacterium aubagnense]WGI33192.1 hypothetical protein QDT91_02000 [Mycolicibacterium aubagnense]BBX85102.1 hypothetical protein MAUB_29750 [Mycolicibacterium aubagnense]
MPQLNHVRIATIAVAGIGLTYLAACSRVDAAKPLPTLTTSTSPPAAAKLTSADFMSVCQGATQSRATGYNPDALSHKTILFIPLNHGLVEDTSTLPSDWTVQFDANRDTYAAIDTVVCVETKDEQSVKECTGYEDNGHSTANKVDLRATTYTITVRVATTGKELATTELSGTDTTCPMFMSFDDDTQTKPYNVPPPKDDLIAFIKQFVQA